MMMISSRQRGAWWPRVLAVVAVLLFMGAAALWRGGAEAFFWSAAAPVVALRNALSSSQVADLQAHLAQNAAALADRDALYKENLELKALLGRGAGVARILAGVLQRPPGVPYDTLLIDAGASESVATGDLVSAGGTTVIGAVTEVFAHSARVTLFSAPGQTHQALLRGTTPLNVAGQGAGSLSAQVPSGTRVLAGDSIVFSGVAGGFVASVSHINAGAGETFETVYMHLPVDLFTLRYVEVQKPKP